jgi:hypothetical protein
MKNILKNALIMSITHFIKTLGMVVINWIILVTVFMGLQYVMMALMVYLFIGYSLTAFANSYLLSGVFDHYIPAKEEVFLEGEE